MTKQTNELDLPTLSNEAGTGAAPFAGAQSLPFLGGLKVRLTAQLGSAELTVAELGALKLGATLKLDRLVNQPVDLLAEGHVVAQGTLVAMDEHFGVRITALPKLA